jgi:hypothetical protein
MKRVPINDDVLRIGGADGKLESSRYPVTAK